MCGFSAGVCGPGAGVWVDSTEGVGVASVLRGAEGAAGPGFWGEGFLLDADSAFLGAADA